MRTGVAIVGGILGVVALAALTGALLPVSHVARRSLVVRQVPESVWAVISDFEAQPTWRKDVTSVALVSEGPAGQVWREEGNTPLSLRTSEVQAPSRLVRTIVDTDLPFGGRWIYELSPEGGGTRVMLTEEGEVYNVIFRLVGRLFLNQAATIEGYLSALSARLGETATPQS